MPPSKPRPPKSDSVSRSCAAKVAFVELPWTSCSGLPNCKVARTAAEPSLAQVEDDVFLDDGSDRLGRLQMSD